MACREARTAKLPFVTCSTQGGHQRTTADESPVYARCGQFRTWPPPVASAKETQDVHLTVRLSCVPCLYISRLLACGALWQLFSGQHAGEPGRVLTDTCASSACRTAPNALVLHAPTASALCRVDAGHGRRRPPLAYGSTQQCLALHILAPPHVAQVAAPSRCCCLRRGCEFPAGLMDQPANLARIRQEVRRRQDTSASL